jgi:hypothetical protein
MFKAFKLFVNTSVVVLAFVFHRYTVPLLGWLSLIVTGATWIARAMPANPKIIRWDDFDWDEDCKDPECKECDMKDPS